MSELKNNRVIKKMLHRFFCLRCCKCNKNSLPLFKKGGLDFYLIKKDR
ncbi:hypothetical protein HMPREF9554_03013 [Treponema phagedenis F0421]|nr:hypothetical protein HMPREF9554_03013 [Treponema phagedenis F0421]